MFSYIKMNIWMLSRYYVLNRVIAYVPCWFLRKFYFKICGLKIEKYSRIDMGNYFCGIKKLSIGKYSHINQGCILDSRAGIEIGNNVSISHRVSFFSLSHDYNSPEFVGVGGKIKVEDYVFVGANATILGGKNGITIGKGAVICAGSVVTKDIESFCVVAGVPAKIIGRRNEDMNYFPLKGDTEWRFI